MACPSCPRGLDRIDRARPDVPEDDSEPRDDDRRADGAAHDWRLVACGRHRGVLLGRQRVADDWHGSSIPRTNAASAVRRGAARRRSRGCAGPCAGPDGLLELHGGPTGSLDRRHLAATTRGSTDGAPVVALHRRAVRARGRWTAGRPRCAAGVLGATKHHPYLALGLNRVGGGFRTLGLGIRVEQWKPAGHR
jgi:hypothetical protein